MLIDQIKKEIDDLLMNHEEFMEKILLDFGIDGKIYHFVNSEQSN